MKAVELLKVHIQLISIFFYKQAPVVWSEWESWTPCSQSCGLGVTSRKRHCTRINGEPTTSSDPPCNGRSYESKTCELSPCPVIQLNYSINSRTHFSINFPQIDGGWGPWSNWTSCSKSCWDRKDKQKPTKKRYRDCNSPKPAMGGRSCSGVDFEEVECNTSPCSINGGWYV